MQLEKAVWSNELPFVSSGCCIFLNVEVCTCFLLYVFDEHLFCDRVFFWKRTQRRQHLVGAKT